MNNLITITAVAYNEEVLMQFFIDHYRRMFPDCPIVIYDNYSTDRTAEIALSNNCTVIKYDSNNEIRDDLYLEIKNNCWKNYDTPWCLQCDIDEICFINEDQLKYEEKLGSTIISFEGWNMINTEPNPLLELKNIKWASRCKQYDKYFLFNKKFIKSINYDPGCHTANPVGTKKLSEQLYKIYHFRALDEDYVVAKNLLYCKRLSKQNLDNNWGFHYKEDEETIRRNYKVFQDKSNLIQIIDENSTLFNY